VNILVFDDRVEPPAFTAVTLNEYEAPNVRPVTVSGLAVPVIVTGAPPPVGVAVTMYEDMGFAALVEVEKLTLALPLPAVTTEVTVGGSGAAKGVEVKAGADAGLIPIAFVAVTVKE